MVYDRGEDMYVLYLDTDDAVAFCDKMEPLISLSDYLRETGAVAT
jgi:hypothetical protein